MCDMYPRAHQTSERRPQLARWPMECSGNSAGSQPAWVAWMFWKRAVQSSGEKTRGGVRGLRCAVCSLQPARSGHEDSWIASNGIGLVSKWQNSRTGGTGWDWVRIRGGRGTPQMAASPSGGRGKSRWRAGGSRCGSNVQVRVGHAASTCRMWILEARIKWTLELCKRIGSPGSPGLPRFAGVG